MITVPSKILYVPSVEIPIWHLVRGKLYGGDYFTECGIGGFKKRSAIEQLPEKAIVCKDCTKFKTRRATKNKELKQKPARD